MHDRVRLGRHARPILLAHPQLVALQITHDRLEQPLLHPALLPRSSSLPTLPQPRHRRLRRLGAYMANDLLDGLLPLNQIAQDERAEEARRTREEDRLGLVRLVRTLVARPKLLREHLGVVRVLRILDRGDGALRLPRKTEVVVTEAIELLRERADRREVEDDSERGSDGERLAELEDEPGREDRVAAEVEEGFVEGDVGGRGGEETQPDLVDRTFSGREGLRVGGGRGGGGSGDGIGEGKGGLVDLAVGVQRHARERDEDCATRVESASVCKES